MSEAKLSFAMEIREDSIYVKSELKPIKVTDVLALMRYMEMHKQIKKVVISGPGGYVEILKDY